MKYKIVTSLLSLTLIMTGMSTTAFAAAANTPAQVTSTAAAVTDAETVDLGQEDGKLNITEAGTYVLTGKLTGCVYVDPGEGDVELIQLDQRVPFCYLQQDRHGLRR